jgi:hypothetical protein
VKEWVEEHLEELQESRPMLPPGISDRAQDTWEPLFVVASVLGDEWLQVCYEVCLHIEEEKKGFKEPTKRERLLRDIQDLLGDYEEERISSQHLVALLMEIEETPWSNWGSPLPGQQEMARLLKPYGIQSRKMRIGGGKPRAGYEVRDFQDVFETYL